MLGMKDHCIALLVLLHRISLQSVVEEHCQHCLKVFPLDELVTHALNCSHRKILGSLVRSSDISS